MVNLRPTCCARLPPPALIARQEKVLRPLMQGEELQRCYLRVVALESGPRNTPANTWAYEQTTASVAYVYHCEPG